MLVSVLHPNDRREIGDDGFRLRTAVTRNVVTGGLTFSWVAVDPNIDAWNPATEEGDPAAVGDRVAAVPLDTPTITEAEAEFGDDGTSARIRITVDGYVLQCQADGACKIYGMGSATFMRINGGFYTKRAMI